MQLILQIWDKTNNDFIILTFNGVTYDRLSEIDGRTPGLPLVLTVHIAQSGDVFARYQLVRLSNVTQNGDEKEEESPGVGIIDGTRVHGSVAFQTGCAQDSHVSPLHEKQNTKHKADSVLSTLELLPVLNKRSFIIHFF